MVPPTDVLINLVDIQQSITITITRDCRSSPPADGALVLEVAWGGGKSIGFDSSDSGDHKEAKLLRVFLQARGQAQGRPEV